MVVLNQGKTLSPGDLGINLREGNGMLIDPAAIQYSIFLIDAKNELTLASPPKMQPRRSSTGVYHVGGSIPSTWEGRYKLIWYVQQYPEQNEVQIYEEFEVVRIDPATSSFEAPSLLMTHKPGMNPRVAKMIVMVRELLSDTDPERNYHFRPPTSGVVVANFNSRVGFIWLDVTIRMFLEITLSLMNTSNPMGSYSYTLMSAPEDWWKIATLGAASFCLSAEGARWGADEVSYSLNGISLDINKSSTYQALASAYKTAFDAALPTVSANRPCSAGCRQQRWLLG